MKKSIVTLIFTLCLMVLTAVSVSAMQTDKLVTNNGKYGFEFQVTDSGISVSGIVHHEDIMYIAITTDETYIVNVAPGARFYTTIKLPAKDLKRTTLSIFYGEDIKEAFTGVYHGEDIVLENVDGKWSFTLNDAVYDNNVKWLSGWMSSKAMLDKDQPNAVKLVTASVIGSLKTDYEKAEAIHKWIADNIYYDKDYALNIKTVTAMTPVEVLTERISVCEGYSNLAVAMLNSAGIPATTVKGYALGVDEATRWNQLPTIVRPNHMWVEAFVDGKWLIMDPTWDSKNMYYHGKKESVTPVAYRYFDITPEMLSSEHKILERPNSFGEAGLSDWAFAEASAAYDAGLVTDGVRFSMKDSITREEFCDLIVNMLTVRYNKTVDEILVSRKLEINPDFFKDSVTYNILAANALGIVNGKENNMFDPKGLITRQEAAVMLQRASRVMGSTKPNSLPLEFSDASTFPSWSAAGISFVSASISKDGTRVMGGVENNRFDPKGYYTKEQSVLTVYRLFNTY